MKTPLIDNPAGLYWASFNCFELRLPGAAVVEICQSGDNGPAVDEWAAKCAAWNINEEDAPDCSEPVRN